MGPDIKGYLVPGFGRLEEAVVKVVVLFVCVFSAPSADFKEGVGRDSYSGRPGATYYLPASDARSRLGRSDTYWSLGRPSPPRRVDVPRTFRDGPEDAKVGGFVATPITHGVWWKVPGRLGRVPDPLWSCRPRRGSVPPSAPSPSPSGYWSPWTTRV